MATPLVHEGNPIVVGSELKNVSHAADITPKRLHYKPSPATTTRMQTLRHSDAVNRIRLELSDMGAISIPYTVGAFRQLEADRVVKVGVPGVADVLACHRGRFVACEIKVGPDRQRPEQKNFQAAIEAQGGIYVLARFDDKQDGVETLRRALG